MITRVVGIASHCIFRVLYHQCILHSVSVLNLPDHAPAAGEGLEEASDESYCSVQFSRTAVGPRLLPLAHVVERISKLHSPSVNNRPIGT